MPKQAYIDFIFDKITKKFHTKTVFKLLLEHYLSQQKSNQPSLFSNKDNNVLVKHMLLCLSQPKVTTQLAVSQALRLVIEANANHTLVADGEFMAMLSAFLSVYQHYIFVLTTHAQMLSVNPLLRKIVITKNCWQKRFPRNLVQQRNNIYSVSHIKIKPCEDLVLLKDCINHATRDDIINILSQHISSENYYVRARACTSLGLLSEFMTNTTGPIIAKALVNKIIHPQNRKDEHINVVVKACRSVGLLSQYVDPNDFDPLFNYLGECLESNNNELKIAAIQTYTEMMTRVSDKIQLLVPYLTTLIQFDFENSELLMAAYTSLCTIKDKIPIELRHGVIESLLLRFDTEDTKKNLYQTLSCLIEIIPETLRAEVFSKIYSNIFTPGPIEAAAQAVVKFQRYIPRYDFDMDMTELLHLLDTCKSSRQLTNVLLIFGNLSPCLNAIHLKSFLQKLQALLSNSNDHIKIICLKSLTAIGTCIPSEFMPKIIAQLKSCLQNEFLTKCVASALISLCVNIPKEDVPLIISGLILRLKTCDATTAFVIFEALIKLSKQAGERQQIQIVMELLRLLPLEDVKTEASNTLIHIFDNLMPDVQLFLLASVGNRTDEIGTKIFAYGNHLRSQQITRQQWINMIFYRTHVEDIAHYIVNKI